MSARASLEQKVSATRHKIGSRPYISLSLFVIIVVLVALLGYARYQYVQAELAAQQNVLNRIQGGLTNWSDDLSMRLRELKDGVQGTTQGAGNLVGGVWGITSFVVTAILDYVGNLHIMIPVTIIYFGIGFFGTLKMRVATLIASLIAIWVSTMTGIVQGSVIGLLAIAGLLFWNKIDPRLLAAIQGLPARLKSRIQQARGASNGSPPVEPVPNDPAENARH